MMWMHVLIVRRSFIDRPLMLLLLLLLLIVVSIGAQGTWWVARSAEIDLDRQASQLAVDVIVTPRSEAASVLACSETLMRRPDVASAQLLSSRQVWLMFQKELGVEAGGLTDVATMPQVIQVHFKASKASFQHAIALRNHVLGTHGDVVERVLIPKRALSEFDAHRETISMGGRLGVGFLGFLFVISAVVFGNALYKRCVSASVNDVLSLPRWSGAGIVAFVTFSAMIISIAIGMLIIVVAEPRLVYELPWLAAFASVLPH